MLYFIHYYIYFEYSLLVWIFVSLLSSFDNYYCCEARSTNIIRDSWLVIARSTVLHHVAPLTTFCFGTKELGIVKLLIVCMKEKTTSKLVYL